MLSIYSGQLKSDSHLPKNFVLFASIKTLKNDEECFLFHLKSSFLSSDIQILVLTFSAMWENDLIRKLRLISKFMTSDPGKQL